MDSIEAIIARICKHAGVSEEEVRRRVEEKQDELSGLISEEGAVYIIARELGLNLLKESKKGLKIKNLVSGLRSVDLVAKVVGVSDIREFEREGKAGKVANIMLGDETGMVRLSLWNEETEAVTSGAVKTGDVLQITGGYVKIDNRGNPELRVGRGSMEKVDQEVMLPETSEIENTFSRPSGKNFADLKDGDFAESRAAIVQIFRRTPFYQVCPECGARVEEKDGKFVCKEHCEVNPEFNMVVSGVVDDGTGNIRAVFFRGLAEKVFGMETAEVREKALRHSDPLSVFDDISVIGKDMIVGGRIRKNDFTERLELIVNKLEEIEAKKEIQKLILSIETGNGKRIETE